MPITIRKIFRRLPLLLAAALAIVTTLLVIGIVRGYRQPHRVSLVAGDVYGLWFDGTVIQFFRGENRGIDYGKWPDQTPKAIPARWDGPLLIDSPDMLFLDDADRSLAMRVVVNPWPPFYYSGSAGNVVTGLTRGEVTTTHNIGRWIYVRAAPAWLILALTAAFPLAYTIVRFHNRRRFAPEACQYCGYDLRATPDRCPECGKLRATD